MTDSQTDGTPMESVIREYIGREVTTMPDPIPIKDDTPLIQSGILDSLSILKLVLFLEEKFGVKVSSGDVIPGNFETVQTICKYLRSKREI